MTQNMFFDPRQDIVKELRAFLHQLNTENSESLVDGIFKIIETLPHCKEEGKILKPNIIISLKALDECVRFEHQQINIKISTGEKQSATYKRALKVCAPLARADQSIYISLDRNNIEFGILLKTAAKAINTLAKDRQDYLPITIDYNSIISIKIDHDTGALTVCHKNTTFKIYTILTPDKPDERPPLENTLAEAICRDITDNSVKNDIKSNLLPSLTKSINNSHGCMIAVVDNNKNSIQKLEEHLHDGIYLDNPIDFTKAFAKAKESKGLAEHLFLQELLDIKEQMINMDGVTVFNTVGHLLAYKVFVKINMMTQHDGGARSRAFNTLSRLKIIDYCFFKSQDGGKEFKLNRKI
ncbi:hypothetical protein [Solidesulfovibrio sp.]